MLRMGIISKLKEIASGISGEGSKANPENISEEYHEIAKEQVEYIEHDIGHDNYEYLLYGKPLVEMPVQAIKDGEKIRYCMHGTGLKTEKGSYKMSSGDTMYLVSTDTRVILRANNAFGEGANEAIYYDDISGVGYNSYFSKGMKQHKLTITTINREFEFSISDAHHGEKECMKLKEHISESRRNSSN